MRLLNAANSHQAQENRHSAFAGALQSYYYLSSRQKLAIAAAVLTAVALLGVLNSQASGVGALLSNQTDQTLSSQSSGQTPAAAAGGAADDGSLIITDSSSLDINLNSKSTVSGNGSSSSSSTMTVNGQPVSTGSTGSLHKTIKSSDGSTTVNISVQNSSSAGGGGM